MQFQKLKTLSSYTLALLACAALTTGCSTNGKPSAQTTAALEDEGDIYDPLEGYNRAITKFNDVFDKALFEPVAKGYSHVPNGIRVGIRNVLRELRAPVNVANQTLQGDFEGAGVGVSRFVINATVGVLGIFDVAGDMGLEYEHEDFGQTLGVWGVDHGAYFVLPFMGPSSLRDTGGMIVDSYADPVRLYLDNTDNNGWQYARMGLYAVDQREQLLDALDDLRRNSFDYYAALRSAYYQKRAAMVRDNDIDNSPSVSIPDYE